MTRLGDVVDVAAGQAAPPSDAFTNTGIPFVRAGSVDRLMSTGNWERLEKLDERAAKAHKMKLFPENTVVFAKSGMSAALARVFKTDRPAYIVSHLAALKPNGKADPNFLAHWLEHYGTDKLIKDPAYPSIRLSDIEEMPFPKLPLPEQRRIAGILDQADALRRLRRQSLSRLSDLGQAIFYEMFGDPISNPKGWDKVELVECVASSDDIRCGPFGTQLLREEFQEDGVPLWGIKQVNRGFAIPTHEFVTEKKAKVLENYTIIPGDIVMTRKGTIGNCSVYPKEFPVGIMHSDLLRLRIDRNKCEPEFISDQLHFSPDIQHQIALISGGAIMQGINVGKLKKIRVLRPPKPLQDEYMRRVHAVQAKRESAIAHEVALDSLFTSLQHRAFRGEL